VDRQRARDRLTGAAVAVVLMAAAVAGLLWWASEPAGSGAAPAPRPPASPGPPRPPADLAGDESWLADVVLDAGEVVTPDSQLRDVRAVARDVRSGPGGARAGSLSVEATVPFEAVARDLGGEGVVVRRAGRRAQVVRTVVVAGRQLRVVATGDVTVDAGRLVVEPRAIDVGGPPVLARRIADVARRLVTIEQDVEGLPQGLVLQRVTVQDDGFRAHLEGRDVRLLL
jgi:hypothetical protein